MTLNSLASLVERLATLSPSQQDFFLQLGLMVIALVALVVAFKAVARRGR